MPKLPKSIDGKPKKNWNYLLAVKYDISKVIKKTCPNINNKSGIYFLIREDNDVKYAYIGKAVHLMDRMVSHTLGSRQAIDHSIRKRGYYDKDTNDTGWHLNVLFFPEPYLDAKEQYYIDKYKNAGYELYNIESGGTTGKTLLDDKKAPKTYQDGLKQGRKNLARELKHIADLHLNIELKQGKENNKVSQNALDKFNNLLLEALDTDKD